MQETAIEDEDGALLRGGTIVSFKAYLELSTSDFTPNAGVVQLRSELQGSGVSLIDTPKSGRKNASDFMLAADMLTFALDVLPPARIFLVSGDRDFAYSLGTLRNRGYEVVLIVPPIGAAPILRASANKVLKWRGDVLKTDGNGRSFQAHNATRTPPSTAAVTTSTPLPIIPAAVATAAAKGTSEPAPAQTTPSQSVPKAAGAIVSPPVVPSTAVTPPQVPTKDAASSPPSKQLDMSDDETEGGPRGYKVLAPLINVLQQYEREGNPRPLRSAAALRLVASDPDVYKRAGATRWAEFAAVATANGLVYLGSDGTPGSEWISLKKPTESSDAKERRLSTTRIAVAANGNVNGASLAKPSALKPSQSSGLAAGLPSRKTPNSDAAASAWTSPPLRQRSPPAESFAPLIEVHRSLKSAGYMRPLASEVEKKLDGLREQGIVDPYAKAGVINWTSYIAAASSAGVARLRETEKTGICTVQIHPKYADLKTTQITAAADRIVDTATSEYDNPKKPSVAKSSAKPSKEGSKKQFPPRNLYTTTYDPKRTDQNVLNGRTFPQEFVLLTMALRDQNAEGRQFSVDHFLHKLLNKLGQKDIRSAADFQAFLRRAIEADIVEIVDGFSDGAKHVRLHSSLVSSNNGTDSSSSSDAEVPKSSAKNQEYLPSKLLAGKTTSPTPAPLPSRSPPAVLPPSTVSEAEALALEVTAKQLWMRKAPIEDQVRFWPLVGTLLQLSRETGQPFISRTRLSGEVPKRYPIKDSSGWTGAWYQAHSVSGFWEYATLAAQKGYISVHNEQDRSNEKLSISSKWFADFQTQLIAN